MPGSPKRCWRRSKRLADGQPEALRMNNFEYVRPATDRRSHRRRGRTGRGLSRRRHQPARPDEGRHRASEPSGRRLAPARARPHRTSARWRRPHRRAGSQCRSRARSGFRQVLSRDRRGAAVRRLGAASQCRDRRRQSAAADALRIFLRCRQRLQQAPAGRGLRCARRREPACTPCSAGARPASPPTRRISACRWSRSTRSWRSRAEPAGARSRSRRFIACPATRPSGKACSSPAI